MYFMQYLQIKFRSYSLDGVDVKICDFRIAVLSLKQTCHEYLYEIYLSYAILRPKSESEFVNLHPSGLSRRYCT